MRVAVGDDFRCDARVQPGNVAQQLLRGRVDFDADAVHAGDDRVVERTFQRRLVHVVLVLPDADALRIDFHQLRERIHQPPPDGDRAAHRDVLVREFLARRFARRINRRAAFVHDDDGNVRRQAAFAHEKLRFSGSRSVADRDRLHLELRTEHAEARSRVFALTRRSRRREHDFVMQQLALRVEHDELAAGAESGIEREHAFLPERRRHQQFDGVGGENADRLLVRLFLRFQPRLGLERRTEQAFPRVAHRLPHRVPAAAVPADEKALQARNRRVLVHGDAEKQKTFLFSAPNREHAMRRRRGERFFPFEIIAEFRPFFFLAANDRGGKHGGFFEKLAAGSARVFVFGNALGDDVARSRERGGGVGNAFFLRDEFRGFRGGIGVLIPEDEIGERLEPAFPRGRRARAPLRLVRRVKVFKLRRRSRLFDGGFQSRRKVPVFGERFQNRGAARVEFPQLLEAVADGRDLHFVHFARGFLAVTRDERHGRAAVEQTDDGRRAPDGEPQFLRDAARVRRRIFGRCLCHRKKNCALFQRISKFRTIVFFRGNGNVRLRRAFVVVSC